MILFCKNTKKKRKEIDYSQIISTFAKINIHMQTTHNNSIAIAKALCIIFMVIGHSGCPVPLSKFIYIFHMPLFFVCSGYFFKEIYDRNSLKSYIIKKIKKLYFPYFKWSLLFLIFHNILFHLNIYNPNNNSYYTIGDFAKMFFKLIFMSDFELLLRPFWFIKELFWASIIIAFITYFLNYTIHKSIPFTIFLIAFVTTFVTKRMPSLPIVGDPSILNFSIVYIYSGILFKKYSHFLKPNIWTFLLSFLIVLIGSRYFKGTIDMRYTTIINIIPYYLLSISGIIMIFCLSSIINKLINNNTLYYIGNHTMIILTLNLFALKLGNLFKIWIYNLPIEELGTHTVISEHNSFFWIINAIIGVSLPLIIEISYDEVLKYMHKSIIFKKKFG